MNVTKPLNFELFNKIGIFWLLIFSETLMKMMDSRVQKLVQKCPKGEEENANLFDFGVNQNSDTIDFFLSDGLLGFAFLLHRKVGSI